MDLTEPGLQMLVVAAHRLDAPPIRDIQNRGPYRHSTLANMVVVRRHRTINRITQ